MFSIKCENINPIYLKCKQGAIRRIAFFVSIFLSVLCIQSLLPTSLLANSTSGDSLKTLSPPGLADNANKDRVLGINGQTSDSTSPYWTNIQPDSGQTNVPMNTTISFNLRDDESGINLESLSLILNGSDISDSYRLSHTGDANDYAFFYKPPRNFLYGDSIFLYIKVSDRAEPANWFSDTTFFVIQTDQIDPVISPIEPDSSAKDVPRNTRVSFRLTDDVSGLDFETFTVKINDKDVIAEIENAGTLNDMIITYNKNRATLFGYSQTVWVYVYIADRAGNKTYLSYSFITEKEFEPPIIEFIYPPKNDSNIPLDVNSILRVTDKLSGIELDSLKIGISANGNEISFASDTIDAEPNGYQFELLPQKAFAFNDTIQVAVSIKDKSGNPASDTCTFYVRCDTTAPRVENFSPADSAENIPLDAQISFDILDDKSGVNLETVTLELDFAHDNLGYVPVEYEHSGDPLKYHIWYSPDLQYNDTVWVRINGADNANNRMQPPVESVFFTTKDTTKPILIPYHPEANETGVAVSTNISVKATDGESGIARVEMWVSLDSVTWTDASVSFIAEDVWEYDPPQDFTAQTKVYVKSLARDRVGNESELLLYSFTTGGTLPDTTPPWVENLSPADSAKNVPLDAQISFDILDDRSGVNLETVKLELDVAHNTLGYVPVEYEHSGDPLKYHIWYSPDLQYNDTVWVRINGADVSGNEMIPFQSVFYAVKDTIGPELTPVQPEPFSDSVAVDTD
ncbi:hypothetical protein JXJ21_17930, partial [candidate division KSB1 bacterium]|nr:hypothetical protein [candidate division KSB1 bacterium]